VRRSGAGTLYTRPSTTSTPAPPPGADELIVVHEGTEHEEGLSDDGRKQRAQLRELEDSAALGGALADRTEA